MRHLGERRVQRAAGLADVLQRFERVTRVPRSSAPDAVLRRHGAVLLQQCADHPQQFLHHPRRAAMKASSIPATALGVLFVATVACTTDRVSAPERTALSPGTAQFATVDENASATYAWHAGDAFLVKLNPAFGPDVAEASNGDRISLAGTGSLSIHDKAASG